MLLRLAYLGITNAFALLRLLPGGDGDKDAEILALRHLLAVSHRRLGEDRVQFEPADRAWPAALLSTLPKPSLHRLRLLVRPDTLLRRHRDLHDPSAPTVDLGVRGPAAQVQLNGLSLYRDQLRTAAQFGIDNANEWGGGSGYLKRVLQRCSDHR